MSLWLKILVVGIASTTVGCGGGGAGGGGGGADGDPLEGTWVGDPNDQDTWRYTFVLGGNGKASVEQIEVNPPQGQVCSGTSRFSGLKWTDTKTTFKITGTECSGTIVCRDEPSGQLRAEYKCDKPAKEHRFVCTYSLSDDGDTLDVSEFRIDNVTLGPATFVRAK